MQKIFNVCSIDPKPNYGYYVLEGLKKENINFELLKEKDSADDNNFNEKKIWDKNFKASFQIFYYLIFKKKSIIHHYFPLEGFFIKKKNLGFLNLFFFPFFNFLLRIRKHRILCTFHLLIFKDDLDLNFFETFFSKKLFIFRPILRVIINYYFKLLFNSIDTGIVHGEYIKVKLINQFGINEHKIAVIHHGIKDYSFFTGKNQKYKDYFLYFGYIHKRKNLLKLIEIFKKNKKHLIIAGIPLDKNLQNRIIDSCQNLNNITILGEVDEVELYDLIYFSNALIFPYKVTMPGSGPVALALGFKKYIFVTQSEYFDEYLKDFKRYIDSDLNNLNEEIKKFNHYKQIYNKVANQIISEYNWDQYNKKLISLYQKLSNKNDNQYI